MSVSSYSNPYVVADAPASERARFIRNTYLHLAMALVVFAAIEYYLLNSQLGANIIGMFTRVSWLVVIGAFMVVSWLADRWAHSATSKAMQYVGLGVFVVAEALIFLPLLTYATIYGGDDVLPKAAYATGFLFAGLTATAFLSGIDFSFLRGFLIIGGFVALGAIIVGTLTTFNLGLWFSAGMVLFAGVSILYTTSQMIHRYHTEQYVAASLGLFAGVALMFFYLVRLFSSRN